MLKCLCRTLKIMLIYWIPLFSPDILVLKHLDPKHTRRQKCNFWFRFKLKDMPLNCLSEIPRKKHDFTAWSFSSLRSFFVFTFQRILHSAHFLHALHFVEPTARRVDRNCVTFWGSNTQNSETLEMYTHCTKDNYRFKDIL